MLECKLTEDKYYVRWTENVPSTPMIEIDIPMPKPIKQSAWSEFYAGSEIKIKFFTGLNKNIRDILWNFLGDAKYSLSMYDCKKNLLSGKMRSISVENQFFLFLAVFRRNLTYKEAGWLFGINPKLAGKVFKTWLSFIYFKFKDIQEDMFIKREDLPKPLPKAFRNKLLRDTRVVSLSLTH